ncbi:MAG TPA: type II toxin-antitoxin system HicB family antitoxin [Solirubrobacterales bacterium]
MTTTAAIPGAFPSVNTVYTRPVAKVMISIPDNLLERLDAQARVNRETRSGFLQRLAEGELEADATRRRQEIEDLLDRATVVDGMGGDAARLIREDRESH